MEPRSSAIASWLTTPSDTRRYEAPRNPLPASSNMASVPSAITSSGWRSDVRDRVLPFMRRPRRASSAESRAFPSRL